MSTQIIATIGDSYNHYKNSELINNLYKSGIDYLRFNFSKCKNINEIEIKTKYIQMIKNEYKSDMKIMIDLPVPGKKPRIILKNDIEKIVVHKGDEILISSKLNYICFNNNIFYVELECIGKYVVVAQNIFYSDGSCVMKVIDISKDKQFIKVIIQNDCIIYNRKSISFGYIVENEEFNKHYLKSLIDFKINSIALSFVINQTDVIKFKNSINNEVEIISKIETEKAITNLDEIIQTSNIMFARGDLLLNSNAYNLYNYQNIVSEKTKSHSKRLYIATGILSSLNNYLLPTQAEIIDLTNILKQKPYGIILNYEVVIGNLNIAIDYIRNINKLI